MRSTDELPTIHGPSAGSGPPTLWGQPGRKNRVRGGLESSKCPQEEAVGRDDAGLMEMQLLAKPGALAPARVEGTAAGEGFAPAPVGEQAWGSV